MHNMQLYLCVISSKIYNIIIAFVRACKACAAVLGIVVVGGGRDC